MNLATYLDEAKARGFAHAISLCDHSLECAATRESFGPGEAVVTEERLIAPGSDPADEANVFLIEGQSGTKGHLVLPAASMVSAEARDFLEKLPRRPRGPS